jgi:hypothetical protein
MSLLSMLSLPETARARAKEELNSSASQGVLALLSSGTPGASRPLEPTSGSGSASGMMTTQNGAAIAPEAAEIVVAYMQASEIRNGLPPALPPVPPSEAVSERAPANPAVRAYPRQADGHGIKLAGYNVSRWAEDWRMMKDPKKRDDLFDRLKYLPLGSDELGYLTLSGEMRLRSNMITNPGLTPSEHRRENLLRIFAGADVHVGPVRFFGELAHGELGGHNYGSPSAKSRNALVAQQMFGEISGDVDGTALGIRYGRQEFTDGTAGFLSQRDDNNIHYPLSGVRAWAQTKGVRIGLFDFEMVRLGLDGANDDKPDSATRFSGINAGFVVADTKDRKVFLDPFFWRERNDDTRWGGIIGREERYYLGARLWGSVERLTFDWAVSHQHGDFRGRDIDAWNAFIAQTYKVSAEGLQPKVGIHFDLGSGGGTFDQGTLRISRAPTAGTIGYSYQGALNITNLFQVSPNITISPFKDVDVTTELQRSWRLSERDAVYRGAGTAYARSQDVDGSHVGDAIRLQASWKIAPRVSLMARYEYFMPGAVLEALNLENSTYVATWASFRF